MKKKRRELKEEKIVGEVQIVKKWWGDWGIESSRAQGTMLEFYPPLPGSLNRQGESGPPTMGSAAPPIPFRPANDNNNAGKVNNFRFSNDFYIFIFFAKKKLVKFYGTLKKYIFIWFRKELYFFDSKFLFYYRLLFSYFFIFYV